MIGAPSGDGVGWLRVLLLFGRVIADSSAWKRAKCDGIMICLLMERFGVGSMPSQIPKS